MTEPRSHAELVSLRKQAQEIATSRKERMTTVHLLAAVARTDGPAGELLRERRLDDEALLKASRAFDDDGPDPVGRLFAAARQIASRRVWAPAEARTSTPEPNALHLFLAILADRSAAAHRSLVSAGIDLARLRTAGMQLSLGVVTPRRTSFVRPPPSSATSSTSSLSGPAERVSLHMSPPPSSSRPERPARADRAERDRAPVAPPRSRASVSVADPPPSAPKPPRIGDSARPISQGVTVPIMPAHPVRTPTAPPPSAVKPRVPPPAPVAPSPAARSSFVLDRTRFPVLSVIGENLSLAAVDGRLPEVVGRDEEIEHLIDVLSKKHASSACVVGAPGVGKTAIARGVAQRMAVLDAGGGSPRLMIELSLTDLTAGPLGRRGFIERVAALRNEARELPGRLTLFIDDLADLASDPALDDAVNELRAALGKDELRLIGTSTVEAFRRHIEPDATLARRFTVIEVEPPDEESAFFLLQRVASGLGAHHKVVYGDDTIAASVSWTIRYVPGRALPDKAISILDLAGARARRSRGEGTSIVLADVAAVVSEIADVPIERLLETDRARMLGLEKTLAERVVGHAPSLARIARVVRRNAAGLRSARPIGSFLLLGPTGVGKTETAKALAEALFHSPDAMTRLDFSEYAEAHAVARLIGAPPGYVGHDAGGQLTEAVRKRPYQVLLLDEIEKAHRDVLEAFLQVFDEGRLTDGRGRRVDFTNTVIVLTSNLGAAEVAGLKEGGRVGFARGADAPTKSLDRMTETMIAAARAHLPPELYNRIDEVLCYGPLSRPEVAEVARRLLEGLAGTLADRGIRLEVEPEVIEVLLDSGGYDPSLGARPMKRTLSRLIENPLAELILRGDLGEGAVALVCVEDRAIVVDALSAASVRETA